MKKIICFIFASIIIIVISFEIYERSNKYNLNILYKNMDWYINTKECENARSFDFDSLGNLYIAYENSIKIISADNKESKVIKSSGLNIYDIAVKNKSIIIATNNSVVEYDMEKNIWVDLVTKLPNIGLNKCTEIMILNDDIYITIGSNTNSGVVEEAGAPYDRASFLWKSSGRCYGPGNTGGFSQYGSSYKENEEIKEESISNGSVIKYNYNQKKISNYATGIRNIKGLDYTSDGKIIAVVGGIENYGVRGIEDDRDYIYELKERAWYGWPDFSGGNPVNSVRFLNNSKQIDFLINNHPAEVVYGPIYEHKSVGSLNGLAVDKEGKCLQKDFLIFADNNEKYLYAMTKEGIANVIVELNDNTLVEKIKYYNGAFYVLDSGTGCIYILQGKGNNTKFQLPKSIWVFCIVFLIILIIVLVTKFKENNKRSNIKN